MKLILFFASNQYIKIKISVWGANAKVSVSERGSIWFVKLHHHIQRNQNLLNRSSYVHKGVFL